MTARFSLRAFLHAVAAAGVLATTACGGAGTAGPSVPVVDTPASTGPIQSGKKYVGRNGYIEYFAGDAPVIITAPHGGSLTPDEIRDRTTGVTVRDSETDDLAMQLAQVYFEQTGQRAHLIINRLHRRKLDANREIVEASNGDPRSEQAWREFHAFVDSASALVTRNHKRGLLVDIHGHGHEIQRVELGYLLTSQDLAGADATLNTDAMIRRSSIRALAERSDLSFAELLRGPKSFGALLKTQGYAAVPSPDIKNPGSAPYFTGGYITLRHGSRDTGDVDGIQIESQYPGLRDTAANRRRYAEALVAVLRAYMDEHY